MKKIEFYIFSKFDSIISFLLIQNGLDFMLSGRGNNLVSGVDHASMFISV